MKTFACGDVVPGCDATFEASEDSTILTQVAGHAERDHGLAEVTPELVGAVVSAIRTR